MCDYKEEQELEIEAIESIYPDSFDVVSKNPTVFNLKVFSEEDFEVDTFGVNLQFTYAPKYPEEKLQYKLSMVKDGEEDDEESDADSDVDKELCEKLCQMIDQHIEENVGMVMVFDVVSIVQDYVNEEKDNIKQRREDEKERIEREEKEAEAKKCHGTRVTVASFMEWKDKFMAEIRAIEEEKKKASMKNKKMTGKEIFMKKGNLADDCEVLEGEEAVEVDESLFEDIDDLELEDELLLEDDI